MFIVGLIVGYIIGSIVGMFTRIISLFFLALCIAGHNTEAHLQSKEHNDPHP